MFPLLMSRWIFLFLCRYDNPCKHCFITAAICVSSSTTSQMAIKSDKEPINSSMNKGKTHMRDDTDAFQGGTETKRSIFTCAAVLHDNPNLSIFGEAAFVSDDVGAVAMFENVDFLLQVARL